MTEGRKLSTTSGCEAPTESQEGATSSPHCIPTARGGTLTSAPPARPRSLAGSQHGGGQGRARWASHEDLGQGIGACAGNEGLAGVTGDGMDGFLMLLAVGCDLLHARLVVQAPKAQGAVVAWVGEEWLPGGAVAGPSLAQRLESEGGLSLFLSCFCSHHHLAWAVTGPILSMGLGCSSLPGAARLSRRQCTGVHHSTERCGGVVSRLGLVPMACLLSRTFWALD